MPKRIYRKGAFKMKAPPPTKIGAPSEQYLSIDWPIRDRATDKVIETESPKCSHDSKHGQWVVAWGGKFYPFIHANNLQKDIWLGAGRNAGEKTNDEERIKLLRWYCHDCGTVQQP